MRKMVSGIVIFLMVMSLNVFAAYAKNFQGETKSIEGNTVTVLKKDAVTGQTGTEVMKILVSPETKLENFASLDELRAGDADRRGRW